MASSVAAFDMFITARIRHVFSKVVFHQKLIKRNFISNCYTPAYDPSSYIFFAEEEKSLAKNAMFEELTNVTSAINETSKALVESVMSTTMINDGPLVDSDAVSPVTLSMEWSRVARLLIMIGLSVIGSIGNVYMISSVMIEDHLNKRVKV
ncbi:hypothetical protein QTP88_012868 [Uroleucon formosanum]